MRKTFLKIMCMLLLTFTKQLNAQQWIKYYGTNQEDKAYAITMDNSGYIYIAGYSTFTGHGADFATIKINPQNGNVLWSKYYNGPASQDDKVYSITVDRQNNIYVAGYTTGIGTGTDMTVVKYDLSGAQLWVGTYNSTTNGDDVAYAVAVDDSLNVYITGFVSLIGKDMYLAKFNSSGIYQWGRYYGGNANLDDKAYAIAIDRLNNIYIGGYTNNVGKDADFTLIKYNRSGDILWLTKYDGHGHTNDFAYCMALSDSNRIYLAGSSQSTSSPGSENYLTVSFNTDNGDTVWARTYNGAGEGSDKVYAITVDDLDNIYITGSTESISNTIGGPTIKNLNFTTIKYSSRGDVIWNTSYDSCGSDDIAKALFVSPSGEYLFVTGSSRIGNLPDSQDIVTIKYNASNGTQLQKSVIKDQGNTEDDVYGIYADSLNNTYIAGYVKRAATGYDMVGVKYYRGDLIEVKNISVNVPKDNVLYQNYPNPFNPSTLIKFELRKSGFVKLAVYDMIGRQVDLLVNENMKTGTFEVNYSNSKLASGIYFYEITTVDFHEVKKMILIK